MGIRSTFPRQRRTRRQRRSQRQGGDRELGSAQRGEQEARHSGESRLEEPTVGRCAAPAPPAQKKETGDPGRERQADETELVGQCQRQRVHLADHLARRVDPRQRPQVEGERPRRRSGSPAEDRALGRPLPAGEQIDLPRRGRGILSANDRRRARHEKRQTEERQTENQVAGAFETRRPGERHEGENRATQKGACLDQRSKPRRERQQRQPSAGSAAPERRHDERQGDTRKAARRL